MINDIETKQEKSIEAIAKAYNTTECSLLASDIRINRLHHQQGGGVYTLCLSIYRDCSRIHGAYLPNCPGGG